MTLVSNRTSDTEATSQSTTMALKRTTTTAELFEDDPRVNKDDGRFQCYMLDDWKVGAGYLNALADTGVSKFVQEYKQLSSDEEVNGSDNDDNLSHGESIVLDIVNADNNMIGATFTVNPDDARLVNIEYKGTTHPDHVTVRQAVNTAGIRGLERVVQGIVSDMLIVTIEYFKSMNMQHSISIFHTMYFIPIKRKIRNLFYDSNKDDLIHDVGGFPLIDLKNVVWSFIIDFIVRIVDESVFCEYYHWMSSFYESCIEFSEYFCETLRVFNNKSFSLNTLLECILDNVHDVQTTIDPLYRIGMTIRSVNLHVDIYNQFGNHSADFQKYDFYRCIPGVYFEKAK